MSKFDKELKRYAEAILTNTATPQSNVGSNVGPDQSITVKQIIQYANAAMRNDKESQIQLQPLIQANPDLFKRDQTGNPNIVNHPDYQKLVSTNPEQMKAITAYLQKQGASQGTSPGQSTSQVATQQAPKPSILGKSSLVGTGI